MVNIILSDFENDICTCWGNNKRVEMSEGKRMVQIITDSSALTTPAEGKALGIDVIPLCVSILDEEYRDLQVNMDYFYGQIAKGGIPRSSQPPLGDYVEAYRRHAGKKILNIAMADGLSGTYLSACGAKEMGENKEDIVVYNSRTLCGPHRHLVWKAAQMAQQGKSLADIVLALDECTRHCESFLIAQDFEFLRRGGRLTPLAAKFGSALQVKPIMQQTPDGTRLDAYGISRTIKGAAKKIMHHFQKKHVGEGYLISISHARAAKDALEIAHIMKEAFAKAKVEILELSPVFVTQGGPQCIAIQYIKM